MEESIYPRGPRTDKRDLAGGTADEERCMDACIQTPTAIKLRTRTCHDFRRGEKGSLRIVTTMSKV